MQNVIFVKKSILTGDFERFRLRRKPGIAEPQADELDEEVRAVPSCHGGLVRVP